MQRINKGITLLAALVPTIVMGIWFSNWFEKINLEAGMKIAIMVLVTWIVLFWLARLFIPQYRCEECKGNRHFHPTYGKEVYCQDCDRLEYINAKKGI